MNKPRSFGIWAVLLLTAAGVTSCKQVNKSSEKSFLALNARVAAGEAPSFEAVAKWFQGSTDSANAEGEAAFAMAPPELRDGLVRYVRQQAARTGELQKALGNQRELERLLDLESREMMDIVLVLINPRYMPVTDDLFAALLRVPGIRDFVDVSAMPALVQIFRRPLNDLYGSMEQERLNYLKALKKAYISDQGAAQKLSSDLARNCGWLNAFLGRAGALDGTPLCALGTSNDSGAAGVGGAVPRFMSLFANLMRVMEWQRQLQMSQVGPMLPPNPGMNQGPNPVPGQIPQGSRQISADAPNLSVLRGAVPQGSLGRGGDYQSNRNPNRAPNGNINPGQGGGEAVLVEGDCPEGFRVVNGECVADGASGNYNLDAAEWLGSGNDDGVEAKGLWSRLTGDPGTTAKSGSRGRGYPKNLGTPRVDCVQRGHRGMALVNCQRYVAYLPKYSEIRSSGARQRGKNFDGPGGPMGGRANNFDIVLYGASPVQNQGSEGACTAFGATHAVTEIMRTHFDPNYTFDAWDLWNRYGNPMMPSAESAMLGSPMGSARVTDVKSLSGSQDIVRVLDSGKAVWAASDVDDSWDGAGGSSATLTCNGNGSGHAYAIEGYIMDQGAPGGGYFIVKNSWGRWWGEDGYGYFPFACMDQGDAEAHEITVQPN